MKKLLKNISLSVLFLSTTIVVAQRAEAPDFQYDLGGKIYEMTVTQGGPLVVATNDGLVGIKPGQNELLFNFKDYGRVKPEEYSFIPYSPYLVVGQTGFASLSSKKSSNRLHFWSSDFYHRIKRLETNYDL